MPIALRDDRGRPQIIVLTLRWGEGRAREDELRTHLRGLGASLLVLAGDRGFRLCPDDAVERITVAERDLDDARRTLGLGRLRGRLAVVVLDGDGAVRMKEVANEAADPAETVLSALASAHSRLRAPRISRRDVVVTSLVAALSVALLEGCGARSLPPPIPHGQPVLQPPAGDTLPVTLNVNGKTYALELEPRVTLLDALRERLALTGTKKGCDHGQCGACTVLVDGRRVLSCLTLACTTQSRPIATIEGLAGAQGLHPVQAAFVAHDGFQCGYCTPGQIMSAVGLLREGHAMTDDEVRREMSGNLCRCGAYPNIVSAVQDARRRA